MTAAISDLLASPNAFPSTTCRLKGSISIYFNGSSTLQAVIGAGAAGLVTARELLRQGHLVTVYEQTPQPGGVWVYTDAIDSDVLGVDAHRSRVHSSMYKGLRTNLPRELMGYSDFPFHPSFMGEGVSIDPRRFCGHDEVGEGMGMQAVSQMKTGTE